MTALRGGFVARLRPSSGRQPTGPDDPEEDLAPQEESALTRLSVVGGSGPESG